MSADEQKDGEGYTEETHPARTKARWTTPRLVVHGTITVQTLAPSLTDAQPAPV